MIYKIRKHSKIKLSLQHDDVTFVILFSDITCLSTKLRILLSSIYEIYKDMNIMKVRTQM